MPPVRINQMGYGKFKKGNYPFPRVTDPQLKIKSEYFLNWNKAIYALYIQGKTGIRASDIDYMQRMRLYGTGSQPSSYYKDIMLGDGKPDSSQDSDIGDDGVDRGSRNMDKEEKHKAFFNLIWKIISPANKIVDNLVGKFEEIAPQITVDNIDEGSMQSRSEKKYAMWREMENREFEQQFMANAGIPMPEPEFSPNNKDELLAFEEDGGFKMDEAIAMEQLVYQTEMFSKWDETYREMSRDAINFKICACMNSFDYATNFNRVDYVDPERLVIQYSSFSDHRDSEYAGYFEDVSIAELREIGVFKDEKDAKDLAEKFSNYYANVGIPVSWNNPLRRSDTGDFYEYDGFKVAVFNGFWIDNEDRATHIHKNRFGDPKIRSYPVNKVKKNTDTDEYRVTSIRKLYESKWIVDTDITYQNGIMEDMVRLNKRDVKLPVSVYKFKGVSLTQQLEPIYDIIFMSWLKMMNVMITQKPPGYAINVDALQNLELGGKKLSFDSAVRMLFDTGVVFYKPTGPGGRFQQASNQVPITALPGAIGDIAQAVSQISFAMSMIQELTGINPVVLGATPPPRTGVKNTELAASGLDNTLKPLVLGLNTCRVNGFDYAVEYIQLLVKNYPQVEKAYAQVVGSDYVKIIKEAGGRHVKYGTYLVAKLTDFEKQNLMIVAGESVKAGRDGVPGLTWADYSEIQRLINTNASMRMINLIVSRRLEEAKDDGTRRAQENSKAQTEGLKQLELTKLQSEIQIIEAKKLAEIEVERVKGDEDRKTASLEISLKASVEPEPEPAQAPAQ